VGGLVGWLWSGNYISNSYSTGSVFAVGSSSVGGFVGWLEMSASVSNSFWDNETSGQVVMCGQDDSSICDDAYGKSISEMITRSTFTDAGWDFTNTWATDSTKNNGYPYLMSTEGLSSVNIDTSNPFSSSSSAVSSYNSPSILDVYIRNAILNVDKATVKFPSKVYFSNNSRLIVRNSKYDNVTDYSTSVTLFFDEANRSIYINSTRPKFLNSNIEISLLDAIQIGVLQKGDFYGLFFKDTDVYTYPELNVPFRVYTERFNLPKSSLFTKLEKLFNLADFSSYYTFYINLYGLITDSNYFDNRPVEFKVNGYKLCDVDANCTYFPEGTTCVDNRCEVSL